jgi:SAM-dependent methyltransferase
MSRDRWAGVAAGWESRAAAYARQTMPVSAWMVDAIAPQPGHTVLELAAGVGDTGFLAAELLRPGGTLISSDFTPEMLSAAQRRAEQLGLTNVRFRQIDLGQPIDQPAASIDGVLCRWGYMLLDDPEAALRETRRILKPDGRLALAAWADPDANRWSSTAPRLLIERGAIEPPEPGPGQFTWAQEGVIAEHLEAAGFVDYDVQAVDFEFRYPSVSEWWATSRAMSALARDARIDDEAEFVAALADAAKPYAADDGSLAIPARAWVAAATG